MMRLVRALIQRVTQAGVKFPLEGSYGPQNRGPRRIGAGIVVLLGVGPRDDENVARTLAEKCVQLRIFPNDAGKFDRSLLDVGGEALIISQFTLYGDCGKGRRPDFTGAMSGPLAEPIYRGFVDAVRNSGVRVETGEFGAKMEIEIINDGPVTLWLDTANQ